MSTLAESVRQRLSDAQSRIAALSFKPALDLVGRVESIGDDIALVSGLPQTQLNELLRFDCKGGGQSVAGIALALDPELIGCAMLGRSEGIQAGNRVHGTGSVAGVPVGKMLLGRVVNALGIPLDGGPKLDVNMFEPVERPAPGIVERELVSQALETGLTVIDAMLALGRGQRELIIGDRETGKTAIAVDAIVNQRNSGIICVYCAVGQKTSSVTQVIDAVKRYGAPERSIFVVAASDDPPGLQFLAPYAACTMAEYFSDRGADVLLVIDDLTSHAGIYRQLSLLLRNPPGREAYPGDIFYIHSRLLERAARLRHERGGGSLTVLPIAATEDGNISAYIPTNLISITDGQIVLEPRLFQEGQKPAINVGKSVSRVGGKTQPPALRKLAENLRLEYAQFLELEIFTRFGGMIDDRTRHLIQHGNRIRAVLSQPQYSGLAMPYQVALLLALNEGILDSLPLPQVAEVRKALPQWLDGKGAALIAQIKSGGELDDSARIALRRLMSELIAEVSTAASAGPVPAN
ncbi:MAG TPA: F0F1 ATP synthase subunit alpha [Candidatus Binataceae bacterium]|nr:F0F1 ATP synthase subunit alpha [Candidatus Binataceae bacterium]